MEKTNKCKESKTKKENVVRLASELMKKKGRKTNNDTQLLSIKSGEMALKHKCTSDS